MAHQVTAETCVPPATAEATAQEITTETEPAAAAAGAIATGVVLATSWRRKLTEVKEIVGEMGEVRRQA